MIHTPQQTHYTIAKHFLSEGVDVFVDKPLTLSYLQAKELYQLAKDNNALLTAGYNRRFVPFYRDLADVPGKRVIHVVKNRKNDEQTPAHAIFDALSHPLDTALFLGGFPKNMQVETLVTTLEDGKLAFAQVLLHNENIEISASIDLHAGADFEEATVDSTSGIYRVQNLETKQVFRGTSYEFNSAPDWEPTLVTRGFKPMVDSFLYAVDRNDVNPVSPESSLLTQSILQKVVESID